MKKVPILIIILITIILTGCAKNNDNDYHLTFEEMKKVIKNTESIIIYNRYRDQENDKVLYNQAGTIVGEKVNTIISILVSSSEREGEDIRLNYYEYPNKKIALYDKNENELAIVNFYDGSYCNLMIKKETFELLIDDYDLFDEITNG